MISAHDTAAQFGSLWTVYLIVILVAGGLIVTALAVALVRGHRRRGGRPSARTSAPALEIAYLAVITAVVIGLLTITLRTESRVDDLAPHPSLRIDAYAFQWEWRFVYPNGAAVTGESAGAAHARLPVLVVPAGRIVQFTLRSDDVLHELFIPGLRFKRYAFPNTSNRFDLVFAHPGRMLGECAQFCGWDHAQMRFSVLVLSPARFAAWLSAHAPGSAA